MAPVADPLARWFRGYRWQVTVHVVSEVTRVAKQHVLLKDFDIKS